MATDNTFYINAVDFANATAVFTDPALTTLAADGFYQAPIEGVATYRELTGGVLAAPGNCTCAISQVLEFNTSPSDLCCISQTGVTYFIDQGTTFDTTTGLYTDSTGQTKAPDDTYRVSGTNTFRVQSGGTLAAVASCPTCPVACGAITIPTGAKGSYNLNVTLGSDLGAIVVYFNPFSVPDGVRGVYNSVSYNALSAPSSGYIKSTSGVADAYTILGDANDSCLNVLNPLPNTTIYDYFDAIVGNAWVQNGTESVTVNNGDIQGGGSSEFSVMVIPKPTASPTTMDLKSLGPCTGTAFNLDIACPAALPSWSTSTIAQNTTAISACAGSGATGFFAKKYTDRNNAGVVLPILYNWVFSDNTGATVLPNGFYKITGTSVAQVANGVVTAVTTCVSAISYSSSATKATVADACIGTVDQVYYHSGSGALPGAGEFVYSDAGLTTVLGNGFYKINATSYIEVTNGTGLVSGPSSFAFGTSWTSSVVAANINAACALSTSTTFTHDNNSGDPVVNDKCFTDACKTIPLANGFYKTSNNTVVSITGGLGVVIGVTACTVPVACGAIAIPGGNQGSYNLNVTLGTDVGAIVVYFNPASIPDGVRGVYDSTSYNALSSPSNGYIKSTSGVANAYTFLGDANNQCIPARPNTVTYDYFDEIVNGAWVQNGTESVTINTGDVQLGGSGEYSSMVIPKPNASPSTMDLKSLGPCSNTAFNLDIVCPTALPSWSSSTIAQNGSKATACAGSGATFYFAKNYNDRNNGAVVLPKQRNWVFSDENGSTVLPNGFYKVDATTAAEVANGVVSAILNC